MWRVKNNMALVFCTFCLFRLSIFIWNSSRRENFGSQKDTWNAIFSTHSFTIRFVHLKFIFLLTRIVAGNLALCNDIVLWNASQLYKDAHSYDYKSVRRWTTPKKLGYSLLECEKVLMCNVYGLELKWKCNIYIYICIDLWFYYLADFCSHTSRYSLVLGCHQRAWKENSVSRFPWRAWWECSTCACKPQNPPKTILW